MCIYRIYHFSVCEYMCLCVYNVYVIVHVCVYIYIYIYLQIRTIMRSYLNVIFVKYMLMNTQKHLVIISGISTLLKWSAGKGQMYSVVRGDRSQVPKPLSDIYRVWSLVLFVPSSLSMNTTTTHQNPLVVQISPLEYL